MSKPVKIYIDYLSQPCRAIFALCLMAKIPFEVQEIRIVKLQHLQPEFKKINPFKKVPVIEDNGFILQESHAILRYLCDAKNAPDHLYPKDPKRRAQVDRYLDWHHSNTRKSAKYFQASFKDALPPGLVNWTTNDVENQVEEALRMIENFFLKDGKYINGEKEITIADISAACEIMQLKSTNFDLSRFSKIVEWLDRCMEHPEMKEAHKVITKVLFKPKL